MTFAAYPWACFWMVATAAAIGAHAWYLHTQGRLIVIDPLFAFWAGFFICNIKEPMDHAAAYVDWHSLSVFDWTVFWGFVGVCCVIKGYELELGQRIGRKLPHFAPRLDPDKVFWAGMAIMAIGMWDYTVIFDSGGGLWEWLSYGRGNTDMDKISTLTLTLLNFVDVATFILLMHINLHRVSPFKKAAVWTFTALLWLWYLYLGSRSHLIATGMMAAAAYYAPRRKNPHLLLVVPAFLALITLTNFQATYRGNFYNLSFNLDQIDMEEAKALSLPSFLGGNKELKHDAANLGDDFNVDMSCVDYQPSATPFTYGYGLAIIVTHWIPRSIWPDKLYPDVESFQGVERAGNLCNAYIPGTDLLMGPAFTFLAFWYNILGPIAVVLGGLYTGVLFRTIRTILDRGRSEGDLLIYCSLLMIGFHDAASVPFDWLFALPFALIPLALLIHFCRTEPVALAAR